MWKNLTYFWRMNLAVLLGSAITTSVLTGALLVGDSVRGSLKDLTLDRLGGIDSALISDLFFRETLAADLSGNGPKSVPAILLSGSAVSPNSRSRASGINIQGIDSRFLQLFNPNIVEEILPSLQKKEIFPSVLINESLQKELNAKIGDPLILSFEKETNIHPETFLGSRDPSDVLQTVRLTIAGILPDDGIGRFGLQPHQNLPRNAFVPLTVLQKVLDQNNRVNAIFSSGEVTESMLRKNLQLEDLGLILRKYSEYVSLESREIFLRPAVLNTIERVTASLGTPAQRILTYLANTMTANGRMIPYSTITAINAPSGSLILKDGSPAPALNPNEVFLNEWAAADLQAKTGDNVTITYFVLGPANRLDTAQTSLRVKGIIKMEGLGADPHLTPDYPGIHDVEHISEWSPPFPIDLNLIRPKDEEYWDRFRATPKAFVSEETGLRLWSSRFGNFTSLRLPASGQRHDDLESVLLKTINPAEMNLQFQPVKRQGLQASAGATDFGSLFLGFSFFLILSSALLVGLLFRLGVEQRASELGILISTGYLVRAVQSRFLKEGGFLAVTGSLLGLGGAAAYAWLMITGLRTWWVAAIGSAFLYLYVAPSSFVIGYLISLPVSLFSIWWSVRKLTRLPPTALLSGSTTLLEDRRPSGMARWAAFATLGIAVLLSAYAFFSRGGSSPALFFGIGACFLISGLTFFLVWLRSPHRTLTSEGMLLSMSVRNSARNPGRSMLSVALVACACFVIVAVGANRREHPEEYLERDSGTGGFSLVAESDIPLLQDLNTDEGRRDAGIEDSAEENLRRYPILSFRLLPGNDVSCLNLYQPQRPRILGAPQELIRRGGFSFQQAIGSEKNPWRLLEQNLEPGVIPAIGDYNSVVWILHLGLGQDVVLLDESGKEIRLRLVALLKQSIFQSELLISESNFLRHFPRRAGFSYFLIDAPPGEREKLSEILESELDRYGFDAMKTEEKLAGYLAVENTYLSTFQTLGGLGLLLGTLGLGIILIRNVIERRGELATLRAFGFRKRTLTWMVLAENGFLLLFGVLIGSLSALVSIAPHLLEESSGIPFGSLAITLMLVVVVGMTASIAAVSTALRIPLLPALKAE